MSAAQVVRFSYREQGEPAKVAASNFDVALSPPFVVALTVLVSYIENSVLGSECSPEKYISEAAEVFMSDALKDVTGLSVGELYRRVSRGEKFKWVRDEETGALRLYTAKGLTLAQ